LTYADAPDVPDEWNPVAKKPAPVISWQYIPIPARHTVAPPMNAGIACHASKIARPALWKQKYPIRLATIKPHYDPSWVKHPSPGNAAIFTERNAPTPALTESGNSNFQIKINAYLIENQNKSA
jgi:hypothetical protein